MLIPSQNAPRHSFAARSAPAAFPGSIPTPWARSWWCGQFWTPRCHAQCSAFNMPRPGPTLCCYFCARTSGDNLIGQSALETLIYVTFMKFREELLTSGLKFAFFFSEG
jgi:hypothetical protein